MHAWCPALQVLISSLLNTVTVLDSEDIRPGEDLCWLASLVQAAQTSAGAYVVQMPRSGAHRSAEDGTANKHDDQAQQRPEGHVLQVHGAAARHTEAITSLHVQTVCHEENAN